MRLGRAILLLALVLGLAWLAMQVVSVNSDDEAIELRVDKQKLRDVGHEAAEQGRHAVEKTEELLQRAGEQIQPSNKEGTPAETLPDGELPTAPAASEPDTVQPGETIRAPDAPARP